MSDGQHNKDRVVELTQAAKQLIDLCCIVEGPCRYDDRGLCKTHWLHVHPCPIEVINKEHKT